MDATIVHILETANRYLQLSAGTPSLNLIRTILPDLRLEMRTALFRATERNQATTTAPLAVDIRGQRRLVQLFVSPTPSGQALVVFLEIPAPEVGTPRAETPGSDADDTQLRQMEEELETTKAQLQGALESAETQHEELRAANEELQSINEEYKSTLEELETSKEELQSINEELKTVNQELKDRVEDLSQANNDLQNLMASTDVATLFVDRQLMIWLYTPSLTQLFNLMPVDQGRPLAHVTHRLDYEHLLRDVQQVLNTLVPVEREVSQDGERYYLMRLSPYRTTDDHIDGVVITFVEITTLKRVEQQVRESETQLRALIEVSAQIVWTTDAAGHVVEDSPSWRAFTGQTYDEWMGRGWLDAVHPEDREHAETTWRQAVESAVPLETEFRLRHVSGGWRWTAVRAAPLRNPDGGVYGWVGMNTDITERKQAEAALWTLTTTLEQRVAERTGELEQAHTNAHHALRQSEPPRQLTLTTAVNTEGTQVTLEVADTGPGIPDDLQRRVFEPFFTTRPQDGGSGLGLSLCRSVIEAYGGAIGLSSQVGHGTTVHITLPVVLPAEVQAPETPGEADASEPTRHGRILLIDDEAGVRRAVQRLLQRSSHDITLAANGHEGLAALEAGAYDLILCDIRMPDLDGPGFYRELERHYPHLMSRVIFLTGDVLSPEAQAFFDQVDCPRLVKPFQTQEMRRVIEQVLETQ